MAPRNTINNSAAPVANDTATYYGGPYLTGPMVYIKSYMFTHFYYQYLVLLTTAPRNNSAASLANDTATTPNRCFTIQSRKGGLYLYVCL